MVVSTYQAASGAGAAAMEELELQTREVPLLVSQTTLMTGSIQPSGLLILASLAWVTA